MQLDKATRCVKTVNKICLLMRKIKELPTKDWSPLGLPHVLNMPSLLDPSLLSDLTASIFAAVAKSYSPFSQEPVEGNRV